MDQQSPLALGQRAQETISSVDANSAVLSSRLGRQQGLPPHLRMINAQSDIEALQQWLQMKGKRSTATYTNYLKEGRRLILWCAWQGMRLADIKHDDLHRYEAFLADPQPTAFWCGPRTPASVEAVDRFMRALVGAPDETDKPVTWRPFVAGLKPISVQQAFDTLGSFFRYLHSSGYLILNPLYGYTTGVSIQPPRYVERYFGEEAWERILRFLDAMPQESEQEMAYYRQVRWIFFLGYYSGARRSEMASAVMGDIFCDQRGQWEWHITGKRKKVRKVAMSQEIMSELAKVRIAQGLSPRPSRDDMGPLVPKIRAKEGLMPISDSMIYKIVKDVCNAVADQSKNENPDLAKLIRSGSTHWLRHTCATHRVDAGQDLRHVQELLGHTDPKTTSGYLHVEKQRFQRSTTAFKLRRVVGLTAEENDAK